MVKDKNGATKYKTIKQTSYWIHFSEWSGWDCNLCGELLPEDERDLTKHLYNKHQIIVENWH